MQPFLAGALERLCTRRLLFFQDTHRVSKPYTHTHSLIFLTADLAVSVAYRLQATTERNYRYTIKTCQPVIKRKTHGHEGTYEILITIAASCRRCRLCPRRRRHRFSFAACSSTICIPLPTSAFQVSVEAADPQDTVASTTAELQKATSKMLAVWACLGEERRYSAPNQQAVACRGRTGS